MPSLVFPSADALRLALTAGLVPNAVATQPVRAATGPDGRVWVADPVGLTRDAVAALGRYGVRVLGSAAGPAAAVVSGWAELVPLQPDPGVPPAGSVLFDLPAGDAARFAAAVRRLKPQPVTVRFPPADAAPGRVWLTVPDPPLTLLLGDDYEGFGEQVPGVWVRIGWRHPVESVLRPPPGCVALLRPGCPTLLAADESGPAPADASHLPQFDGAAQPVECPTPVIPVPVRLRSSAAGAGREVFWVLDATRGNGLLDLLRDADERVLRGYSVAVGVSTDGRRCTVVRAAGRAGRAARPLLPSGGWVESPDRPGLHIPFGVHLQPLPRARPLADALGLSSDTVTWLTPRPDGGVDTGSIPASAFRPLSDRVSYTSAPATALAPPPTDGPLALPQFGLIPDPAEAADEATAGNPSLPGDPRNGWLARSLGRLLRPAGPPPKPARPDGPPATAVPASPVVPSPPAPPRLSAVGAEWAARRAELERRVLGELPALDPPRRADLWAALAEVYAAVGNPADAAVCWVNAAWDRDPPPPAWVERWAAAEAKAARAGADWNSPAALLARPPGPPTARLVAAFLVAAAARQGPTPEPPARLAELFRRMEPHEPDLPARAVWLARVAIGRLAGDDPLGLARCRDRLFRRMDGGGPGLDVDVPSFLRFEASAGGERVPLARDWLARVREPIHRWLGKLTVPPPGGPGPAPAVARLQWAGLDAETVCTAAYADLLLAWGAAQVGDRARARQLEAGAAEVLTAGRPQADRAVHDTLLTAFRERIQSARAGRPATAGLPTAAADRAATLDELGRYAVDRLRAASGILEPLDRVNPFAGRDLRGLLGTDPFADRLAALLEPPTPPPPGVAAALAAAAADPTSATLPRAALALLAVAPQLDAVTAAAAVRMTVSALELAPEWVRVGVPGGDRPGPLARFLTALVLSAAHAAAAHRLPDAVRPLLDYLSAAAAPPDAAVRQAVGRVGGGFFRALRGLGLGPAARELLTRLDPPGGPRPGGALGPGLAVGWFAAGEDERATRLLDAARHQLFVSGVRDERERTALAVGYAAALGHAPPRVALGRLEELFLRLDGVAARGATNRYFTVQPLQLIDAAVRSAVGDGSELGPAVRGWLEADEFLTRRRITRDLAAAVQVVHGGQRPADLS